MKPAWRIDIDGGAAGALLSRQLASIVVHDEAGFEADSISFTVSNENGRIAAPRRGVVLSAHLGFEESGLEHIGDFTVDYVAAHGPVQTLEIGGAAVDLRTGAKAPKTRAWRDQTLHDIAETIAGEHGLTARVTADLGGVRYPHLSQTGESDLHFLTRLSDELGAIAKVAEGVLVIAWRGRGQTVSGQQLPTIALSRSAFAAWSANEGDRPSYESCDCWWHDRRDAERKKVTIGSGEPRFEIRRTFADKAAAERAGRARLADLNRSTRRLSGQLAVGRPEMRAEQPLSIAGLDALADGDWITTAVTHRLEGVFTTLFEAELLQ